MPSTRGKISRTVPSRTPVLARMGVSGTAVDGKGCAVDATAVDVGDGALGMVALGVVVHAARPHKMSRRLKLVRKEWNMLNGAGVLSVNEEIINDK